MTTIYYKNGGKDKEILTITEIKDGSWIHVESPTERELQYLTEKLNIDQSILTDAMDKHEIPRIEVENKNIYLFTRFAYMKENQIKTAPILIVIGKTFLATISRETFPRLEFLLNSKPISSTTNKMKLLIRILNQIQETFNTALHVITKNVRVFTYQLEKIRNKDIIQFVLFENDLHDFSLALVKTNNDLNTLLSGKITSLSQSDHDQVEDLILNNSQLIDICNENTRTIVNLREAYSTILTNNLNRIIKLFTSLTVILTIPTMISSFFGMNVALPSMSFFQIVLGVSIFCGVAIIIFIYMDWL